MNTVRPYKILAISGSLREKSLNSALLRSVLSMVPLQATILNDHEMAQLPHFNPDLDGNEMNTPVAQWRRLLKEADGVLICTPEYAKGVPGCLKNALDWVVSSGELVNKPVAVICASPHPDGGAAAFASLLGTLKMMGASVVEGGTLTVPFINKKLGEDGEIKDAELKVHIENLLNALFQEIK
ncbi:NAD(P)H-dependent FMN reductase [Fictibacillus solisalsi]|uniref:NAD(P)H-dependent FMN reductase n=1 Tax=Fictibacillus solisalsi TaxID=459525 RepID=A0A1G9YJ87_9BACL|nr:NADPH-dependent FMN reductase [Fictibacillus solisalsi]SDN09278.1 NAD(P)H-dependent FMN reductase [Fictibacillus solisalsi]